MLFEICTTFATTHPPVCKPTELVYPEMSACEAAIPKIVKLYAEQPIGKDEPGYMKLMKRPACFQMKPSDK